MVNKRKKLIYVNEPPEGLFYIPGFFSAEQQQDILKDISTQPFEPYDHHGYKANREVVYFGTQGGYNGVGAEGKAEPMPGWLCPLRDRFAHLLGLSSEELQMALVARYDVGAGIGWHRDRPQFGPSVFGVSLASDAEMRFRRMSDDYEEMFKINLEAGSAYLISGPARSIWQHGMKPVSQIRYSITFRTIRDKRDASDDPRHAPAEITKRLASLGIDFGIAVEQAESQKQLKLAL